MSEKRIDSAINVAAIKTEVDYLDKSLTELAAKIKEFPQVKGLFEGADNLKKLTTAQRENAKAGDELEAQMKKIEDAEKRLLQLRTQQEKTLQALKLAQREQTKENQLRIKLSQAEEGSVEQLGLKLDKARLIYDKLAASQRNTARGTELLTFIQNTSKEYDALRVSTDRFQQRVGNYQGSAKIIVDAFDKAKVKVQELNATLGPTTPEAMAARKEFDALDRITRDPKFLNISAKIGDTTAELKFFQKSLIDLQRSGLGKSQAAEELKNQLAVLTKEVKDARGEVKLLASDTRSFDLFAGAVSAIASSVQTFAGANELFGNSSEDVTKSIQKLVAIQNVANGVREIAQQITEKGTAANKAYAYVQGLVATMTNASASATQRLGAALKFAGIGLALTAITFIIDKLGIFSSASKDAANAANELNDSILKLNEAFLRNVALIQDDHDAILTSLKDQLAVAEKSGTNQKNLLALRKQVASEEKKIADEQLERIKRQAFFRDENVKSGLSGDAALANSRKVLLDKIGDLNDRIILKESERRQELSKGKDDQAEVSQKTIDSLSKELESTRAIYDGFTNAEKKAHDAGLTLKQLAIEEDKLNADERRKLILETTKIESEAIKSKNDAILTSEKSSLKDRLTALQSNFEEEKKIIEAEKNNILNDPARSKNDKTIAIKAAEEKTKQIQAKLDSDIVNINEVYRQRDLSAEQSIQESKLAVHIKANEAIAADENKSGIERARAEQRVFNDQKTLIETQRAIDLSKAGLTASEREAIETKANNDIIQARVDFLNKLKQLAIQAPQTNLSRSISVIEKEKDQELLVLSKLFSEGKINKEKYDQDRLDIEKAYSIKSLSEQLDYARKSLGILKAFGVNTVEAEKQIAALELQIQDAKNDQTLTKQQKTVSVLGKISDAYNKVFDTISKGIEASATAKKNDIQDQIDSLDKLTQKEIDAVNKSVLSEQDKAARIAVISATAQSKKEALQRRQKQIDHDQAVAAKANAIFQIVLSTATAIANDIKTPWKIAFDAAIGAAQLAIAAATPIPKFAKGKNVNSRDDYEGVGLVGEAGRELRVDPDGSAKLYSAPTFTHLQKGTKIFPNNITEDILAGIGMEQLAALNGVKPYSDNSELLNLTGEVVTELRSLNKKSRIVIHNERGIESSAWYQQHMKY